MPTAHPYFILYPPLSPKIRDWTSPLTSLIFQIGHRFLLRHELDSQFMASHQTQQLHQPQTSERGRIFIAMEQAKKCSNTSNLRYNYLIYLQLSSCINEVLTRYSSLLTLFWSETNLSCTSGERKLAISARLAFFNPQQTEILQTFQHTDLRPDLELRCQHWNLPALLSAFIFVVTL